MDIKDWIAAAKNGGECFKCADNADPRALDFAPSVKFCTWTRMAAGCGAISAAAIENEATGTRESARQTERKKRTTQE